MAKLNRPYAEVLGAVRAYVSDGSVIAFTNLHTVWAVEEALGGDGNGPGDPFYGQVTRALGALVQDGTLVKVSRGSMRPSDHGWWTADEPYYYRASEWDRLVAEADDATTARQVAKERRAALAARATGLGLNAGEGDGLLQITVDVDSFEALLDAYEQRPR